MATAVIDQKESAIVSEIESDFASGSDLRPARSSGRVPMPRILLVLNQLAVMTQNGIDLAEAIDSCAKHCTNPVLGEQLDRIYEAISNGKSFSQAIAVHGTCFPPTFAPMIAAAEATGDVPDALKRMAQMIRSDLLLRGNITAALIYPCILIGASGLVIGALVFGILPRFAIVFRQLGRPAPALTQFLMDIGTYCRENTLLCIAGLVGGGVFCYCSMKLPILSQWIDRGLLYAPVFREAYRPLTTGRLFRLLGAMLHGGVPLLDAIRLAKRSVRNQLVFNLLKRIEEDLLDGLSASKAMSEADFLPPEAAQMLSTAERTGRLSEVLGDVGVFYEEDGAQQLKKLVSMLEPVIILGMGVLVSGIVMSIMLPLLDVSTSH